jgi:hypothetical protein
LAEDFLADLCADWTKHGAAVISKVRNKNPTAYFRTIAAIIPRELPPQTRNEFDGFSNEELGAELINAAQLVLGEEGLKDYMSTAGITDPRALSESLAGLQPSKTCSMGGTHSGNRTPLILPTPKSER